MSSAEFMYGVPTALQPYVQAGMDQYVQDQKDLAEAEKKLGTPDNDFCSSDASSSNVSTDTPCEACDSDPDSKS